MVPCDFCNGFGMLGVSREGFMVWKGVSGGEGVCGWGGGVGLWRGGM